MSEFPSVVPSYADMVAGNRELPEKLRESAVLLSFAEPIKSSRAGEFLRLHMTPNMLLDGEEEFYEVDVFQPDRADAKLCRACGDRMRRISPVLSSCSNPKCAARGKRVHDGPVRGVIDVLVFPDFVVETTTETVYVPDPSGAPTLADVLSRRVKTSQVKAQPRIAQTVSVEWIDRCVLVLDRRYNPMTLAAVYRTAGTLCDMFGWRLAL
mgnify:FL=1